MELEIVQTVLTDMLEEQKATNQLNQEVAAKLKELEEKVNGFEQKLETVHLTAPPVDVVPVQKELSRGMAAIAKIVEAQPKNVIRQVRLLLFPETNSREYYKIIFGRIFPWGLLFLIVIFVIGLGKQYMEGSTAVREQKMESDHYRQVYQYMYDKSDNAGKKFLQDVWDSTWDYKGQHKK